MAKKPRRASKSSHEAKPNRSDPKHPPVVGIGASAGGLAALKTFFQNVPDDPGMAFVVVVHLAPDHESHLADLLQPHARLPVTQVRKSVQLEANHIYVIAPGHHLSAVDSHVRPEPIGEPHGQRAQIDHFFRTLADTNDGQSIAVVLTGTGSDGALGLRRIKERNGVTIVQDPAEAEFDGMPRAALATGIVDLILPVAEIPRRILGLLETKPEVPAEEAAEVGPAQERLMQHVFTQLRARTGHDFSGYKRTTVGRRIERRMQLREISELGAYVDLLREDAGEVQALGDDLLINVTSFFRDPAVYEKLGADVLPALFAGRGPSDRVRIWSVGCATGEEAYTLAMVLLEESARHPSPPQIQLFATDLHESSLRNARDGHYPDSIELDVSRERLERFFVKERDGYRVRRELRDLVVFASHNVLRDPPFTRVDLVSCRNLLIYLQRDVQEQVMGVFHYALNDGGFLLLGSAETVETQQRFRVESKRHYLYRRRDTASVPPRFNIFPMPAHGARAGTVPQIEEQRRGYGALHARIVEQYAPPSMLVNEEGAVVHLSEQAGRYLLHPGGALTNNVFSLVRDELRAELRAGLHAARSGGLWRSLPIPLQIEGAPRVVVLRIRAAERPEDRGFSLVVFDEMEHAAPTDTPRSATTDATAADLEGELHTTRERLQAIIEEHEAGREEMRTSNDELQSMNEELRSTMEELETSREELQSINEELQTLNQENKHRVEELSQLSGDLQNVFASTDIATLFIDRNLRILRFTPRVKDFLSVRESDRGRPLSDLTHRLGYPDMIDDARRVLERLIPVEREIADDQERSYLTRILPYRGVDDRIEGVVLTFVDISARKRAEDLLRVSEERFRRMANIRNIGVLTFDVASGHLLTANDAFLEMTGYTRAQLEIGGFSWISLTAPEDVDLSREQIEDSAVTGRIGPYEKRVILNDGSRSWMLVTGADMGDGTVVEFWVDVSDAKAKEEQLRILNDTLEHRVEERTRTVLEHEQRFRMLVDASAQIVWTATADGRFVEDSPSWRAFTGQSRTEWLNDRWLEAVHDDDREKVRQEFGHAAHRRAPIEMNLRLRHKSGEWRWMQVRAVPVVDALGAVTGWIGMNTDVTATVEAEQQLRETRTRLTIAEQRERRRIAEILHNDLQQRLFGLQLKLDSLRGSAQRAPDPEHLDAVVEQSVGWIRQTIDLVRRLSVDLSPPVLQGESIEDLFVWLQAQMQEMHGLRVDLDMEPDLPVPDAEIRILLFHTLRELLFNVVKHSGIRNARLTVREENRCYVITVADHGKGLPEDDTKAEPGYGLFSIRDRVLLLGGDMQIESLPGRGTSITLRLPITHPNGSTRPDA